MDFPKIYEHSHHLLMDYMTRATTPDDPSTLAQIWAPGNFLGVLLKDPDSHLYGVWLNKTLAAINDGEKPPMQHFPNNSISEVKRIAAQFGPLFIERAAEAAAQPPNGLRGHFRELMRNQPE